MTPTLSPLTHTPLSLESKRGFQGLMNMNKDPLFPVMVTKKEKIL